jgi:hypothetical protein
MTHDVLLLDSRTDKKYLAIKRALAFSRDTLDRIRQSLHAELGEPERGKSPLIAVSGSFGRLEASSNSDVDCMIVYPGTPPEEAKAFRERVYAVLNSITVRTRGGDECALPLSNPKGVFAGDADGHDLCVKIGSRDEAYDNISRRVLLLLESQALWNDAYFDELRSLLTEHYARDVAEDETKHFVLLINDLIRYFRTICVNYHAVKGDEPDKWPIRNIKLRHSRIVMYTSLLFCLGELSKFTYGQPGRRRSDDGDPPNKVSLLAKFIKMPPLERFVHLYEDNGDDNLFRLLSLYNNFLDVLADKGSRDELFNLPYEQRYESTSFAALKANSDSFAAEIMRFLFARRGAWSDRFYEYMIL